MKRLRCYVTAISDKTILLFT